MKFRTLTMAVTLMAALSIANVFAATPEVTLTTAQQEQVLQLQAAGKITQADSLKAVFTAQTTLDLQKAAARAELRKLAAKKQSEREAVWAKAVSKLTFEESMQWAADDSTGSQEEKLGWLNNRWVERYGFKTFDEKATLDEVLDSMWFQVNERRAAAKQRIEIDTRVRAAINPLRADLEEKINAGADADVKLAQIIGNLNEEVVDLQAQIAEIKTWQTSADSKFEILLNTANAGRVNIAACMEALKYAKYNGSPENAKHAAKFVANAKANTQPVTFPENDTE